MISLYTESHRRETEIARMLTRPKSTVYDVINNYLIVIRWKINKEVEDQNLLRSVITANSKDLSNRTEGAVGVTLVHSLIKSGTAHKCRRQIYAAPFAVHKNGYRRFVSCKKVVLITKRPNHSFNSLRRNAGTIYSFSPLDPKVVVREVNRRFPANVMALEKTEMEYTRSVG